MERANASGVDSVQLAVNPADQVSDGMYVIFV